MDNTLPSLFLERLKAILPRECLDSCIESFSKEKPFSVRINTLQTDKKTLIQILEKQKILFEEISWYKEALVLKNISPKELGQTQLVKEGFLYIQSLSSMLPSLILAPQPGEYILDMCAAPGGKTTQMASLMQNRGFLLAVDKVKNRYYKLRSVIALLGAKMITAQLMDARKLKPASRLFDKILVDAPCSSEGRFKVHGKKTFSYWKPRKIKEMAHKQKGLILSAARLLKAGGVLVYSTCTFAPEENEEVIDWLIRKTDGAIEVVAIDLKGIRSYPSLLEWQGKRLNAEVSKCLRVLPDKTMEGFFMAKLRKKTH